MTTTSDPALSAPRFRLQTFGTIRLVGAADETVLGDHGHQRRRLALLAVLAASGERGRSRDQLLGLFWPDVSQSRARHSLEQLLYAIRTSLDASVFAGMNPVRLNAAFVSSDIGDFADALGGEKLEAAVEMYRGPFLEGFYLSDAPEFEQWMDAERARIERSYTEALERLAKNAEDAGDFAASSRWLRKLIDTDPVSSRHATGLIRALMNVGDHASALRYAERYEAIVAQELGTSVGPAVAELVAEVRARAKTESVVVRGALPLSKPGRGSISPRAATPDEASTDQASTDQASTDQASTDQASTDQASTDQASTAPSEGSKRESRGRRTALYGVATLALTALAVAAWGLRTRAADSSPTATDASASIAVLPLSNLSGDPRDAALADGISEELIGVLSKIDRLRVVARTSAFVFRNSDLDVRRIADSLQVSNILEGGVQKAGQRIRVQVRLVDARDGSTRWSETYDRELKDIFLVQRDIASAVARELDLRLGGRAAAALRRTPTQNIAAYELYLRGNDPLLLRSDSSTRLGMEYFKKAIELDPAYAAAYAGLARTYLRTVLAGGESGGTSVRQARGLARDAALKALALDDSLAEAHATLGLTLMWEYDFAGAEKALKRAIAIDPGYSRAHEWLALVYHWTRRPADALGEAQRAVEHDPLSPSAHAEVARALCANRQYDQGLARLKRIEAVKPPLLRAPLYSGLCYAMKKDWPAAIAAVRQAQGHQDAALRGHALARAGQQVQALALLTAQIGRWERTRYGAFEVAVIYAGFGNRDQTFEWLNRSIDDLSLAAHGQRMLPLFDDLHADPRFEQFRRRLGL